MAIPDYQSLMLPVLQLCGDKQVHTAADAIGALAQRLKLSKEERALLLPRARSGPLTIA